jgi:plastocyanin
LVVVASLLLVLASGCAQQFDRTTASQSGGGQNVQVDMAGFAFRPITVAAKADVALTVKVRNRDVQHHTFTVDGGLDVEVAPGEETTVSVPARPAETNTYYFCRFHESDGMKGKVSHLTTL